MKKLTHFMAGTLFAALALAGGPRAAETILFEDDFETDSSALWNTILSASASTADATIDWAFDYTGALPPAPNSAEGDTSGVRLSVNNADETDPDTSAINLYAEGQNFSGDYALRFDMWINYNGGPFGGSGSTEFGIFGLNHLGTQANWGADSAVLSSSDGIWYAVTGEGGAAGDYRNYEGDGLGAPLRFSLTDGGFLDRDADGTAEQEVTTATAANPNYPLTILFPSPEFETAGMPGKRWVEVELRQQDGVVTWVMDGYIIAQKTPAVSASAGTVMLGMMDIFSSVANPAADNFVIFDNVRVVSLEDPALPSISLTVGNAEAFEPSLPGSFTLARTGDTSNPLEVQLRVRGTATPGADYQTIPETATIPAGASSVEISVNPLDDQSGEDVETVRIDIVASPGAYEVFAPMTAAVNINDDGDVTMIGVEVVDDSAFEGIALEDAVFSIYRVGDTSGDFFVNFTLSGTATSGTDYEATLSPAWIPAGQTNALISVSALADSDVDPDETVIITLEQGAFFEVVAGAESATASIREVGPILYADDFATDTSDSYSIRFGAANNIEDYRAIFAYDYSQGETFVPPSPRGDGGSSGLLVTVNKDEDTGVGAASLNVYTDDTFSGDYLVKFDMFLNYDSAAAGTTEAAIFGINHSGGFTNRYNTAGSDGIWFFIETDASSQGGRSYVLFHPEDTSAVPPFESRSANEEFFDIIFPSPPHLTSGTPAGDWVDVSILQENDVITWKINNHTIFRWANTTTMDSGKIMLGHADTFNSIGSTNNFTIYDNLRVYQIGEGSTEPSEITITEFTKSGDNIVITATTTGSLEDLQLVASDTVNGTYTEVTNATIEVVNETTARATIPITGDQRFFQVQEMP